MDQAEFHALITAAASNTDLFDSGIVDSLEDAAQQLDSHRELSTQKLSLCAVVKQRLDENHIKWRDAVNAL